RALGVLYALRGPDRPPFGPDEIAQLEAIVPEVARAVANAHVLAEERWQRQKAELLVQAAKAIHAEPNFDQAVREIALLLKHALRVSWVGLCQAAQPTQVGSGPLEPGALRLLASTAETAAELRLCAASWDVPAWPALARAATPASARGPAGTRIALPA